LRQPIVILADQIHAAGKRFDPIEELPDHDAPLHRRAMLWNDPFRVQLAHHVHPVPAYLVCHHVSGVERFHEGAMPLEIVYRFGSVLCGNH